MLSETNIDVYVQNRIRHILDVQLHYLKDAFDLMKQSRDNYHLLHLKPFWFFKLFVCTNIFVFIVCLSRYQHTIYYNLGNFQLFINVCCQLCRRMRCDTIAHMIFYNMTQQRHFTRSREVCHSLFLSTVRV